MLRKQKVHHDKLFLIRRFPFAQRFLNCRESLRYDKVDVWGQESFRKILCCLSESLSGCLRLLCKFFRSFKGVFDKLRMELLSENSVKEVIKLAGGFNFPPNKSTPAPTATDLKGDLNDNKPL